MTIFVIGINHHTAPITVREKVYFTIEKLPLYLQDLLSRGLAREAVLLSTCNRSELYAEAEDEEALRRWFCAQTSLARSLLDPVMYGYRHEEAVAHMKEVACGLDSMVLGEPQILGQLKVAFSESCSVGAVGSTFYPLFQQIFSIAKEIRTTTAIGACPVSVASAAVYFARSQVTDFGNTTVGLIGAGETAELLLRYLKNFLQVPVLVVNRNQAKALALVGKEDQVYGMELLPEVLSKVDIVFSVTGSAVPVLCKEMVAQVMQKRSQRPLILIDIAVPRDIGSDVAEIEGVKLYDIDDLKTIIEKNRQGREHAAEKARELIQKKAKEFMIGLRLQDKAMHTIRAYRGQIEEICHNELLKARHQLQQGIDPEQVLKLFAYAFTQKLLHVPSVQLRQAGVEGHTELLRYANQLFAIPDPEVERL